jgi:hypothetical protein
MTVEVPDTDCDSEFEFGLCKRRVPTRSRLLRSGSPQPTVRNKSFEYIRNWLSEENYIPAIIL